MRGCAIRQWTCLHEVGGGGGSCVIGEDSCSSGDHAIASFS